MGKAKTHQGTAKRIGITARGKMRRGRQMAGHLKIAKSPRQLRALGQEVGVDPRDQRRLARLLPYKRG
jgi:large subunit ribosomal protein L35